MSGFTASVLVEYLSRVNLIVRKAVVKDGWLYDIEAVKQGQLHTPEDFVHNAYFEILGRPVDIGGLQFTLHLIHDGMLSVDSIHAYLRSSNEYQNLINGCENDNDC